jgi:hypothetical protein
MGRNWVDWHAAYDEPGSPLRRRLALVQQQIREALDATETSPISVISMCAGQGRDLLGVLADRTGTIREWFSAAGFAELAFHAEHDLRFGVGAHRFTGRPLPFEPDVRMFAFTPDRV